jgi:hypothetical protein
MSKLPDDPEGATRLISLRFPGWCEVCGLHLAPGKRAWHDPVRKRIRCRVCGPNPPSIAGEAGNSARREYERRAAKEEFDSLSRAQLKQDGPLLNRFMATAEPQHVTAWSKGAEGERKAGALLDTWAAAEGGMVLHDRRISRDRANVDHIAVGRSAVWVIDTKAYRGRVEQIRAGGRNRSRLVEGVRRQMTLVAIALDNAPINQPRPPVYGVLCFVDAAWAWFRGTFLIYGVHVAWPAATIELVNQPGAMTGDQISAVAAALTKALPPA